MSNISKVVLITGATSGMGKLTSKFLSDNGYIVYAGTRDKNAKPGEGLLKNIYIDVTKTDTINNAVDTAGFTFAGGVFTLQANCLVTYVDPAAADTVPTITTDVSGC